MSRSGYVDGDDDQWASIRYRGAVKSAIRGRRGQAFLREMLAALDAMPEKRLIAGDLVFDGRPDCWWMPRPADDVIVGGDVLVMGSGEAVMLGEVCALGCLGKVRGLDMHDVDAYDPPTVAGAFGIAEALAREIVWVNDEGWYGPETPEMRWHRVRVWILDHLVDRNVVVGGH